MLHCHTGSGLLLFGKTVVARWVDELGARIEDKRMASESAYIGTRWFPVPISEQIEWRTLLPWALLPRRATRD